MKIFIGTVNIAGQLLDYAKGFQQLGHEVTVGTVDGMHPFSYATDQFIDLSQKISKWTKCLDKLERKKISFIKEIPKAWEILKNVWYYDIFLFQWPGYSFTYGNKEYALIKKLKKRIVQVCNGDDTRHWTAFLQEYGEDLSACSEYYAKDPIERPYTNLRHSEKYADLIISRPSHAGMALLPYLHFFYPVDLSEFTAYFPERKIPRIVHAPSARGVKGSDIIEQALQTLRREGVDFELDLLEGRPNAEVKVALEKADIAIDQLLLADYGKFAIEAAASGCAVAVCDDPVRQYIPAERPFCRIDKKNIVPQLKKLITDTKYRNKCAKTCHRYAAEYHNCKTVCEKVLLALDKPWVLRHEFYKPTFYAEKFDSPIKQNAKAKSMDLSVSKKARIYFDKIWGS